MQGTIKGATGMAEYGGARMLALPETCWWVIPAEILELTVGA